jgi:sugar lactone lactonase YvrE
MEFILMEVFALGGLGSALFELNVPWGMYVEPSTAIIYVADSGNNRVMKYVPGSATGTAVAGNSSGYLGVAANLLEFPWSVVVDSAGTIYVSDTHNNRVQKFVSGSLVGVTVAGQASGVSGSSSMDLNFPKTVMLDAGGQLYVLDYGNQRIQRFSPNNMTGTTIFSWCSGTAPDQIGRASHMTFDTFGNLIITDDENYRVQKYLLTCGT